MVTIPYVEKSELMNMHLTYKTDKIGFFYFILRVRKVFSSISVVKLSKNLNHKKIIKHNIENLSYKNILDIAFKID